MVSLDSTATVTANQKLKKRESSSLPLHEKCFVKGKALTGQTKCLFTYMTKYSREQLRNTRESSSLPLHEQPPLIILACLYGFLSLLI